MLTREDLEGEGPLGSLEALTLRNAAPKLALACLGAVETLMDLGAEDAAQELLSVLEAAGVEVG